MADYNKIKHTKYDEENGIGIFIVQPDGCFCPTCRSDLKIYTETSSGPFCPICEMYIDYALKFAHIKFREHKLNNAKRGYLFRWPKEAMESDEEIGIHEWTRLFE